MTTKELNPDIRGWFALITPLRLRDHYRPSSRPDIKTMPPAMSSRSLSIARIPLFGRLMQLKVARCPNGFLELSCMVTYAVTVLVDNHD